MSLRSKTKRRLLILIGLLLLVGAGLFWVVRAPRARDAARAAELRKAGMALYERGDHAAAMPKLSDYLALVKIGQKQPTEAELEALFAFGDCRRRIPLPRREHLREASDRFQMYLEHRPANVAAQRLQAELLTRLNRPADATLAAERVLAQDPADRDALYYRAAGLYRRPRPDLPAVQKAVDDLLARDPGDVRGLLLSLRVKLDAAAPPAELVAQAEQQAADHPNDARYELAVGWLYHALATGPVAKQDAAQRVAWEKQMHAWLRKAATRPPTDPVVAEQLAEAMDRAYLFAETIAFMRTAVDKLPAGDEDLERALVRRLWQNAGYAEVVDRTAKLAPRDPRADVDTLAYRAMSLQATAGGPAAGEHRTRLMNDADAVADALAARTNDAVAQAWALVIRAGSDRPPGAPRRSPTETAATMRKVRETDPDNAVAAVWLGDLLAAQRETDPAVQLWDLATRLRPDWGYPHARIGQIRADENRTDAAEWRATQAWLRWPTNRAFIAQLLQARHANLGKQPPAAALEPLLADVEKVQRSYPNDPGTLPLQVTLLANVRGTGPATARLQAALDANPPLPTPTLLQLQAVDAAHNLGKAAAITAVLDKRPGAELDVAARRASELLAEGNGADGLKHLEAVRAKVKGETDPRWGQLIATHLDRMNDSRAAKAWADLGEATTNDLAVQSQILRSPARFRDRDLWSKTIDRVRALTGDDGSLWKIERARWLLADPAAAPKARAEAIGLLTEQIQRTPDSVEAHVLLGLAFGRDGQRERAAEALTVAAAKAPARADIGLELVQALRAVNKPKDALGRLTDVAALPGLTPEQRVRAAGHFEDLGRPGTAVELLAGTAEGGERDARLGRLYRAMGRSADAAAAYKRVLNDPVARAGDVFAGADFFAAAGDAAATRLFLDRLQTMPQSDAVTRMALGQFEEAYGSADKARALLTKATELAPTDPLAWRTLAGFLVRSRKYADAAGAVDAGLAAVGPDAAAGPAGAELAALKPLVAIVRGLADVEPVRPLVEYLTKDPTNPAAGEMLQVLAEGQAAAAAPSTAQADRSAVAEQTRDRLAKLADKHPTFWPLQEEVIRHHLANERYERAADLAERAVATFPALPGPAKYAVDVHAATGRWDKAVEAATVWRERTPGDPVPADIALANALIGKGQRLAAVQALEPHVRANPLPAAGPAAAPGTKPTTNPAVDGAATTTATATQPALKPYVFALYQTYGRALIGAARPSDAADRLRPLLQIGTPGRLAWLGLATAHRKEDQATRWIEQAAEVITDAAPPAERLALADAWLQAGRATGSAALIQRADDALKPMMAARTASVEALVLAAYVAHHRGDYARAERFWRSVRPATKSPDVPNNLAYALLLGGRNDAVAEARALADEAVAAAPRNPTFLATQARAAARQGQRDAAVVTYRKVLELDARNVEAMVGLAEELAKGSPAEADEARKLVDRARRAVDEDPLPVAPELKKQLEVVRASVEAVGEGK